MAKFSAEKYKQELAAATSIEDVGKKLMPRLKRDQNYVFISYSHRDYKKVYRDLADLRESGVAFWFDEGLPAGENWIRAVRRRLEDPRCMGVIFYLSDNLFLSQSLQVEINMVCGRDAEPERALRKQSYFTVNLTRRLPSAILQKTFSMKKFNDVHDKMGALQEWMTTLTEAFSDQDTYLPFASSTHREELVREIGTRFHVYGSQNPFSFEGASFLRGCVTIEFDNGSFYQGEFRDGKFDGYGRMTYSGGAVYEGQWKNGNYHGQGMLRLSENAVRQMNGGDYMGQWRHMKLREEDPWSAKVGYETLRTLRSDMYRKEDPVLLVPKYVRADEIHKGLASHSLKQWENELYVHLGSVVFDGQWEEGVFRGQGTVYFSKDVFRTGIWEDTRLVEGRGVIRYPDGSRYDGEIRNNLRHGQGTLTMADGTQLSGTFRDDEFQPE